MISDGTSRNDAGHGAGLDLPNYLDLLRVVWRRKSIVALGLIVGIGLGLLYYWRCVPVYQAEAQVLVVQKRPEAVTGDAAHLSHFEDYVATHRVLIQSPLIVD